MSFSPRDLSCKSTIKDSTVSIATPQMAADGLRDFELSNSTALSPLDGRYWNKVKDLSPRDSIQLKRHILNLVPKKHERRSEDINNLAHALMLKEAMNVVVFQVMDKLTKARSSFTNNSGKWQCRVASNCKRTTKAGEIGSSTMPHKVNLLILKTVKAILVKPNEAYLISVRSCHFHFGRFNCSEEYGRRLRTFSSRLQKCIAGNSKASVELSSLPPPPSSCNEASIEEPYEKLKELTRGRAVAKDSIKELTEGLELPEKAKDYLLELTPHTYVGAAIELGQTATKMETGIACCARGAYLPGVSQHSKASMSPRSISPSTFGARSLKSSSLFGETLRFIPRSSLRVSKAKNSSLVTRCEIGDSLEEFLAKATPDKGLIRVMMCMGEALRTIAFKVRTASCGGTACVNSFGDEQLAVDMLANNLLFEALTHSHFCKYACSEEVPELQDMGGPVEGGFSVAFDPLDGSSIVDTNFSVGTIFGVWPGEKLTGVTGRDQVAAAMGVYGPRTTYVLALKDYPGTHEFLLLDEGKWQHVKETTEVGEGKLFSPGNLRATFDNPDYEKLINYYVKEKYTLRYTGGMVPDVNQIIVKEKGVFTNVISPSSKAKLRLLFEVAPLGLLVENAGGYSSDGHRSVLDKEIINLDDRTQVAYGSKNEIIRFEETLYGKSRLKAEGVPVGAAA
ncbi:SBPASE protein [Populus alba x Populus x berolinensis]|nr:SBPASE protein [Populus alba x Populus x berolinensis]